MTSANRFTINPTVRRFAGSLPPFVLMLHRGRSSGEIYRTSPMAFPTGHGFVIALTYGRQTDWMLNVLANGGTLVYRGHHHALESPGFASLAETETRLPPLVACALRRLVKQQILVIDAV